MDKQNLFALDQVNKKINEFSENMAFRDAHDYYNRLKNYLEETAMKQTDQILYNKYYKNLVKLKFLALNFMEEWSEIEDLVKNHLETIYEIELYNLWKMIKVNLLMEPALDRRNKIKEELKNILLECDRPIIKRDGYPDAPSLPVTAADWLKDYISSLGNKEVKNMERIEYLINGRNVKKLDEEDRNKVKALFDLYENLKFSSSSRQGFEEDIPLVINNKLYIFTGGEAEEIPKNVIDSIKRIKVGKVENKDNNLIAELKQLATQYPTGSLERKAIEEEIEKLQKKSR